MSHVPSTSDSAKHSLAVDARQTVEKKLADYFDDLARSGGVAPAKRFRLEGYLQCVLDAGLLSHADLSTLIQRHISQFNQSNDYSLLAAAQAWELPYAAPIAPVK